MDELLLLVALAAVFCGVLLVIGPFVEWLVDQLEIL